MREYLENTKYPEWSDFTKKNDGRLEIIFRTEQFKQPLPSAVKFHLGREATADVLVLAESVEKWGVYLRSESELSLLLGKRNDKFRTDLDEGEEDRLKEKFKEVWTSFTPAFEYGYKDRSIYRNYDLFLSVNKIRIIADIDSKITHAPQVRVRFLKSNSIKVWVPTNGKSVDTDNRISWRVGEIPVLPPEAFAIPTPN